MSTFFIDSIQLLCVCLSEISRVKFSFATTSLSTHRGYRELWSVPLIQLNVNDFSYRMSQKAGVAGTAVVFQIGQRLQIVRLTRFSLVSWVRWAVLLIRLLFTVIEWALATYIIAFIGPCENRIPETVSVYIMLGIICYVRGDKGS